MKHRLILAERAKSVFAVVRPYGAGADTTEREFFLAEMPHAVVDRDTPGDGLR